MHIEILTLFPEMCETVLSESIIGRARRLGALDIGITYIRDFTDSKQGRVDDAPYGGGMGMVLQVQPIDAALSAVAEKTGGKPHVVYMSPKGKTFTQDEAKRLSEYDNIAIICGHYEGIDERVIELFVDEEISIGDFVLTGGELPALCVADAIARMQKGVLSDDICFSEESHFSGLLEYPHYTRPQEYGGLSVPDVLLSGNHAEIEKWRRQQSLRITKERRPDMLEKAELSEKDKLFLESEGK